ncbi:hypothetical protein TBLA_0G02030 [Henningerozyma blattae CBS 6284]|uniref:RNA helicase n=1 Tax=Henningerozyma blattae (strain ATCC 34711 / CBS 6284 / DSM 70876 / NBRC 10599 / NRRL Y-10934 / UCD 77-7) TaxID=1071380 RepID=I2H6Z3_HENB6|nr:hypothetical protein TBLA_0G02030 [Tetrapisispora blattae CBS 6284]CCH62145.1 hypothetical protein TBLA_0G02030 [Tetrapisispora blattae CBS 6284]
MAKKSKSSSKSSSSPTPNAGGKKKGKAKGKEEERQEIDEKQSRKLKQQENRTKVTSTSSWTGKLPHTLLHETCQKRKWNKVEYDMKKIGDKGMLAIAVISYTDPKTKEILTIRMNDPTYDKIAGKGLLIPQETSLEARHYAATVALCRIAYNTNMHTMLPPNHRNLWLDLTAFHKKLLKENEYKAGKIFDSDPFKTLLEDRKQKDQKDKELRAKNNQKEREHVATINIAMDDAENFKQSTSKSTKKTISEVNSRKIQNNNLPVSLVHFPKKAWEKAPLVDFDEKSRNILESALKLYTNWSEKKIKLNSSSNSDRVDLKKRLLDLQFRAVHVDEALKYNDPLSFLLFNLPEDDLPPFFQKRQSDSKNIIEISSLPLNVRNMIDRLMESGVSKDKVYFALEQTNHDEALAASYLTEHILSSLDKVESYSISEDESLELWNQELEGLQSVYEERIEIIEPNKIYSVVLNERLHLKLRVYKSQQYPYTIPGIIVSTFDKKYKLPNYIKQQILKKLLQYINDMSLLGNPLIYDIFEWLQDNVEKIIKNPGPLLPDESVHHSSNIQLNKNTVKDHNKSNKNKYGKRTISSIELKALSDEYSKRIKTLDYKIMQDVRANLPAWKKKSLIVDLIMSHQVVLITGETGSGKSTQVVQFLLDSLQTNGDFGNTNIICTQPRRISAIGLAERVSEERCVECGDEVGYIIRGVNKTKPSTRIKFMTTGVLVRILQNDTTFLNNTIIVIDEVHERSIDTDLIVILLKNLLSKIKNLKIVLMSATVNVDIFKNYFPKLGTCHIEGRTFPIKDYYLEDVLEMVNFKIKKPKGKYVDSDNEDDDNLLTPGADSKFFRSGQINYDLIIETVDFVHQELDKNDDDGSIIVFLPGVAEINKCCRMLSSTVTGLEVLPLHSALSPDDQKRVFKNFKSRRKVVVSTNIAETSITIDDCVCTIDTGKAKTMFYNPKDNTTRLTESFISQAESKQRRGRAGRVREGMSFKLFSRRLYEEDMVAMPAPEIKRVSLESLYLSVKSMGIKNVKEFLRTGLESPPLDALNRAEKMLQTIGLVNEYDSTLTELGKYVSLMPVMDSKHGKLLVYSIIFGCADIGILLVSLLGIGAMPFVGGSDNRDNIRQIMSKYNKKGDLLAMVEIVSKYLNIENPSEKRSYMNENYLSFNKMRELKSLTTQYYSILKDVGFLPMNYKPHYSEYLNRNSKNLDIISAILIGASYPNVASVELPDPKFLATAQGAIEKDPEATSIKYWIRNEQYIDKLDELEEEENNSTTNQKSIFDLRNSMPLPKTRAFIHPSSITFSSKNIAPEEVQLLLDNQQPILKKSTDMVALKYPFMIYNSAHTTSKLFLSNITPVNTLSVLLFGGPLHYEISEKIHSPGIILDNWLPIRTWCKNGLLIKELRNLLDESINSKLENPDYSNMKDNSKNDKAEFVLDLVEKIILME